MIVPSLQLSQMGLREGSDLCKVTEGPAKLEAGGAYDQARQCWDTRMWHLWSSSKGEGREGRREGKGGEKGREGRKRQEGEGKEEEGKGGRRRERRGREGGDGREGMGEERRETMPSDIQMRYMHKPYLAFAYAVPSD